MNWHLTFWLAVGLAIAATLSTALLGYAQGPILEFALTVEGVLVAEMALYQIMRRMERAKLKIMIAEKQDELLVKTGFVKGHLKLEVRSLNKTLKDARVLCNNTHYPWIYENGKTREKRDILVGESPACFSPLIIEGKILSEGDVVKEPEGYSEMWIGTEPPKDAHGVPEGLSIPKGAQAIRLIIREATSGKEATRFGIVAPLSIPDMLLEMRGVKVIENTDLSIRIIAEGIEEVRDYSLALDLRSLLWRHAKDGQYLGLFFKLREK